MVCWFFVLLKNLVFSLCRWVGLVLMFILRCLKMGWLYGSSDLLMWKCGKIFCFSSSMWVFFLVRRWAVVELFGFLLIIVMLYCVID